MYTSEKNKNKNKELRKAKQSLKKGKIIESVKDTLKTKNARNIELENYNFKVKRINNYIENK